MTAAIPQYRVRCSPRAQNPRLRVSREEGLCVVVPVGYDKGKIPGLLQNKREWIAGALKRIGATNRFFEPPSVSHLPDVVRLVALGETWPVIYRRAAGRAGVRVEVGDGELVISGSRLDRKPAIHALKAWLRTKVREGLFPAAERLAAKHNLGLEGLLVKNQRTRWASCSVRRNLSLNTKLLFLSSELVRYVMIHELCHTVHMNHSREFWRLVESHEPAYRNLDRALREAWKTVPQWAF